MNNLRYFDILQKEKLGKYIYALRDPRDRKIFYIGQGTNDRLFDHFKEAEVCFKSSRPFNDLSSKVIRILDIWKNSEDVQWLILSHNLPLDSDIADYVESAIVDSLSESQNGETLNDVSPPKSSRLLPDDLDAMAADFVNPQESYKAVFIFPIQNALANGATPYNATRTAWTVGNSYSILNPSFAVGLKNSISKGSFEILSWIAVATDSKKQEFISLGHPKPTEYQPLLNKNWNNIIAVAKGFWQRGNYLIVEFDGKGKFRITRGSQDTTTWHDCIQ
jgi:hypothetical protein